ncbi:pentatricopeptide repeat-containing protein At2g01510, mitochondrial [Typha latifolia]|uniref:pentatricopeptide repeat-containing protein At2g01510, mitochondrial n=1 Tax=Typha latifolia TaxID=4733 RepID=UPI003C2B2E9F
MVTFSLARARSINLSRSNPSVQLLCSPPTTKAGFAALLRCFSHPAPLSQLHALILTSGLSHKNGLLTHLLISLSSSGHLAYARDLFDGMHKPRAFLWNTLLRAYVKNQRPDDTISLYHRMRCLGIRPDNFTFPFVLRACADLIDVYLGMAVHAVLLRVGLVFDAIVETELMVMYAKLGESDLAEHVFEELGRTDGKDLIAWNALISAFSQNGHADKALKLFKQMELEGVEPDSITLVSVISSCAYLGCLELGRKLHRRVREEMQKPNVFVDNALLDMYTKCGCMDEASKLFDEMRQRNVVSWSTMIGGYAINGDSRGALALFSCMEDVGVRPNEVTFLAILTACSHAGLVSEGKQYFRRITNPRIEHYATMVALLGRSGHLKEAYSFIKSMPIEPDAGIWGALLGACTTNRNTELGQLAADQLLRIAPDVPSYHVLLSNIYAACGRWDYVEKIREKMKGKALKKVAAYSSVEMGGEVHVFYEGSHSWSKDIYGKLDELTALVRGVGYAPMTGVVLHDVEVEEKEAAVGTHSEKLAIAFSLIKSKSCETPLRIMKNLRICSDCHAFFKYTSKALNRVIIIRDKSRFHHFRDGQCSCNDFW